MALNEVESIRGPIERPRPWLARPTTAKLAFKGVLFEVWQWEQRLFDGRVSTFEQLSRPDTVLVLPVLDDGRVVFVEECQPGTRTSLRAVGGRVERDEDPVLAAKRELAEETGLVSADLFLWDVWQPAAKIDWAVYLFVAHGVATRGPTSVDGGEKIALKMLPAAELLDSSRELVIEDYELLHKVYFARADDQERTRIKKLLGLG